MSLQTPERTRCGHPWMVVLGFMALFATLVLGATMVLNRHQWLPGAVGATIVSTISAIASMFVLSAGLKRDAVGLAGTFVASWLLRSAISVGGCVLVIFLFDLSAAPTLLIMTLYYFAILWAETLVMLRALGSLAQQG